MNDEESKKGKKSTNNLLSKLKHLWLSTQDFLTAKFYNKALNSNRTNLKYHSRFVQARLNKLFKGYQDALKALTINLEKDRTHLDSEQILQILRLAFISDEHIKLLPLTYYTLDKTLKALNILSNLYNNHNNIITDDLSDIYSKPAINQIKLKQAAEAIKYFNLHNDKFGKLYPRSVKLAKYLHSNTNLEFIKEASILK